MGVVSESDTRGLPPRSPSIHTATSGLVFPGSAVRSLLFYFSTWRWSLSRWFPVLFPCLLFCLPSHLARVFCFVTFSCDRIRSFHVSVCVSRVRSTYLRARRVSPLLLVQPHRRVFVSPRLWCLLLQLCARVLFPRTFASIRSVCRGCRLRSACDTPSSSPSPPSKPSTTTHPHPPSPLHPTQCLSIPLNASLPQCLALVERICCLTARLTGSVGGPGFVKVLGSSEYGGARRSEVGKSV